MTNGSIILNDNHFFVTLFLGVAFISGIIVSCIIGSGAYGVCSTTCSITAGSSTLSESLVVVYKHLTHSTDFRFTTPPLGRLFVSFSLFFLCYRDRCTYTPSNSGIDSLTYYSSVYFDFRFCLWM